MVLPSFDKFTMPYIDAQTLLNLLSDYSNPRDCISRMVKKGKLIRLKNGFYLITEKYKNLALPFEQIANLIYGPSYVSLEWALSYYEMIPERVFNVTSVTTGKTKEFQTSIGLFDYHHIPLFRYDFGVEKKECGNWPGGFLIASKEKALLDLIFIKWKNFKNLSEFINSTRIDIELINKLNKQDFNKFGKRYKSKAIDKFLGTI